MLSRVTVSAPVGYILGTCCLIPQGLANIQGGPQMPQHQDLDVFVCLSFPKSLFH
jgi:hypothetical protein